jgi:hypothetical protein
MDGAFLLSLIVLSELIALLGHAEMRDLAALIADCPGLLL